MSMRCEDVRPLLAELVYEEVDPGVAEKLREHLGTCLSCRRHQMAFEAVRQDLQEWQPAEQVPSGATTFIAPGQHAYTPIWHSRIFQGLAAAASFVFVALLTAAAVNLQVQTGPDGWAVSTTFGQSDAFEEPEPPLVALDQIPELDRWFNTRLEQQLGGQLDARGVVTLASLPEQNFFTPGQVEELNERFALVLDERFDEHDQQIGSQMAGELDNVRFYVDSALEQQSTAFFYHVANVVDGIEATHRDQLFEVAREYSAMFADTDRRILENQFRIDNIDNLLSLAAPSRSPEQ
jgi:hypothetical protein